MWEFLGIHAHAMVGYTASPGWGGNLATYRISPFALLHKEIHVHLRLLK